MLNSSTTGQFEVRVAREGDIDDLVAFNARTFRPAVGVWARSLLTAGRPGTSHRQFLVVEELSTRRIVAGLCMLPQEWSYAGISIPVSQMELVATDPDYRGRGFMRMQTERLAQMEREAQCLVSCVQGLPGLYQRFGYEYAIPLKGGIRISLEKVDGCHPGAGRPLNSGLTVRRAGSGDYSALRAYYQAAMEALLVSSIRSAALWDYQDRQPADSEHAIETHVLEHGARVAGYFRVRHSAKLDAIVLVEATADTWDGWRMILDAAVNLARAGGFNSLLLRMPETNPLYQAVRFAGGDELIPFAWQVKVIDWPGFLKRIAPVLEGRMARSLFANWTGKLAVRLRESLDFQLCFEDGKMTVRSGGGHVEGDGVDATAGMFTQLIFGYRSSDELRRWHPDFRVAPSIHFALDTLFPKLPSYVYETY